MALGWNTTLYVCVCGGGGGTGDLEWLGWRNVSIKGITKSHVGGEG